MANHAMFDIETMGFTHGCVVLTLGAVKFDPYNLLDPHTPLYVKIDVDEQTSRGRTIDDSTMEWWGKQPQSAQDEAFDENGRISMEETTNQLSKYLVGVDKIWAQGPLFDVCIMEHFYKMIGKPVPWQYWQIRDSRTIGDMGDYSAKTGNKDAHNALADAYSQAIGVQRIYKERGVKAK
jgi:hypothetical protein